MSYPKQSYFDDVADFHQKFELPLAQASKPMGNYPDLRQPNLPELTEFNYRLKFMQEELIELMDAYQAGNLADAADAIGDLVWVALGTAHHMGLPFDEIWAEISRANMEKTVGPPDPNHKRPGERIRKPPGWVAPDHRMALGLDGFTAKELTYSPDDEFAEAHGGRHKNIDDALEGSGIVIPEDH